GDNINNVARGASYGLYTGILLGLYVTYGVSDSIENEQMKQEPNYNRDSNPPQQQMPSSPPPAPPAPNEDDNAPQSKFDVIKKGFALYPIIPIRQNFSKISEWGLGCRLLKIQF